MFLTSREDFVHCLRKTSDGQFIAKYKDLSLSSVFQPIFKQELIPVGVEALVRIKLNSGDMIRPDLFFSSSDVSEVDKINVERLSRVIHLRNFAQSKYRHFQLFLNVLPAAGEHLAIEDLHNGLFASRLNELSISHSQMVMEIVELTAKNEQILCDAITHLDENGFRVAIDDYGVNASNRQRVELLKPHIVKMDRSLLLDFMQGSRDGLLSGIELARKIGASIVAEGIETQEQLTAMRNLNIDMFQGYFLATPESALPIRACA